MNTGRRPAKRDSTGRRTDRVKKREARRMETLFVKEGLNFAEIASRLGRDVRTVKARLLPQANAAPGERWLNDALPQLRQWAPGLLSDMARVRLEALGPVATDAKSLQAIQSLLTVQDGENQRWAAHFSFETHPFYDLLLRAVPGLAAMLEECRAQAVAYRLLLLDRAFKPENWSADKSGQLAGIRQAFDKARGQAREAILRRLWMDAPG